MIDELDDSEHSERGPSTAHRWRRCKASVRHTRGLPDTAGIEAAYGTVFHHYAALCVEFWLDPQLFVGSTLNVGRFGDLVFDQAMADNMQYGLQVIRSYMDEPGVFVLIEERVSLRDWVSPKDFGTTDFTLIDVKNWRIISFDWKYGAGVPVSPVENDQAMLYVLGAWSDYGHRLFSEEMWERCPDGSWENAPWEDDIEVTIIIEQPRAEGGGGVWTTNMGHLLAEGEKIRQDAAETEDPHAEFVPGPIQCKFCAGAKFNTCAARAKFVLEQAQLDFDSLEDDFAICAEPQMPDVGAISPEQRSQILLHKDMILKFLDDLHAAAYRDAEKGRPVPGMKLVAGRTPPRAWVDEAKAGIVLRKKFGEDAEVRKLLSPSQVEEMIGKKEFNRLFGKAVRKGDAKPILVPETHKKEALRTVLDDFDDAEDHALI